MRNNTMAIGGFALLLALILLPLSVAAWGKHGSAGTLTDVEPGGSSVWIDFEPYTVDAATKLYDHRGQKTTLERLDQHIDREVTYVVRETNARPVVVTLRVHELIED